MTYAPIVKRVAPAVVNVYAAKLVENRNPLLDDPIFRRFFGNPGGPREQIQRSLGSGVVIDPSGFVVTNNHVIEGADQVKVSFPDKREFEAEIVLKDARSDLAVLRIGDKRERFTAIDLGDSDALQVGDVVLALGNPFGVGQTVTHGIVSAVARTQVGITDYQFFIQTDAAINPGNSGGALVDIGGKTGRHQYGDLLALRRLPGYRLCDPGEHGARGCGFGKGRCRVGASSMAWSQVATGDAGDRREPEFEAAGRRARQHHLAAQSGGAVGPSHR